MAPRFFILGLILVSLFSSTIDISSAQTPTAPVSPAPSPDSDTCNGIFLSYAYTNGERIPPILNRNPTAQPYRFESTLTVLNNGLDELKSWQVFVGFQHNELLVSASNAVLVDGTIFPADVGNGTVFAGFPSTDLKTAIDTAGDLTQMAVQVNLVGTQFGVASPRIPMPVNISLVNDGFACPQPTMKGTRLMEVCCIKDDNLKTNITLDDGFLPRQKGDLTIMYDVLRTYDTSYWAQVTIANHNPLGRLDYWKLSWDWMVDEFINTMKGAHTSVVDSTPCIFGKQGQFYQGVDFAKVMNCQRRPTIVDLPLDRANDTNIGKIPQCCRNGTILPPQMDPSRSVSAFQMEVFKMSPDLNRSKITPPQNWQINGTLNPDYQCGPPVRVRPSQFPDSSGLPVNSTAFMSWQVVCNITQPKGVSPRCCVSYSAFYNESVVPCRTCACGCPSNTGQTCSTTSPALLLPSQALLVPFENRTDLALAWADLKHFPKPNPMPCPDNCGVSINWHLNADFTKGWTSRITVFNWEDTPFADWFVAVEMGKAFPGFEKVYSFNGTTMEGVNNTIFMQGLKDFNFLVAETDSSDPKKTPRIPGKQQSVISFTKKQTPGINVVTGDGFPTKVFFNGEECSLPTVLPANNAVHGRASTISLLLSIAVAFLLLVWQ